jgi:hypothetical protein
MFDLDCFITECRAALMADPSHRLVREAVARVISEPAAVIGLALRVSDRNLMQPRTYRPFPAESAVVTLEVSLQRFQPPTHGSETDGEMDVGSEDVAIRRPAGHLFARRRRR